MKDLTRRELFANLGKLTTAASLSALPAQKAAAEQVHVAQALDTPPPPPVLPGTEPFTRQGDLAAQMVEGMHQYLLKQTTSSVEKRQSLWRRDFSSPEAYERSVVPNRERFRKIVGLIDQRIANPAPQLESPVGGPVVVASGSGYKVYGVRWPVFEGVDGEGLLLEPAGSPVGKVVALPDADWSPETLVGLAPGIPPEAQFARRLAENGCVVLVPTLINRADTWSGNPEINRLTNLTHREYIYRMAYEIGRHIIGYEMQRVLAAVEWFAKAYPSKPIGVFGYGEGGLLALYSAAADTRINSTVVSGYFDSRQGIWQEPLYRNVWALLYEFGDAELATLIAPRTLIIEASRGPEIAGPPPARDGRSNSAASGRLVSPALSDVQAEVARAKRLGAGDHITLITSGDGQGQPGSEGALRALLRSLGATKGLARSGTPPRDTRANFDGTDRLHRQFQQLVDFTQHAVIESELVREKFWKKADSSSVEKWNETSEPYRRYLWEEVFGNLPEPSEPLRAYTRTIYKEVGWTGYEVYLPLWPEVYAYGILLLPCRMAPGERRPVVVCQHGLEGRPQDLIKPDRVALHFYHEFAADLANHGFVIYCPQNPYIGGDKFRKLQRLANPLKLSLFSFILSQHKRTLEWLSQQPFVDPGRIGFYGLSYGGKTAVRVPPLLDQYALSICSGDFNEWIWKVSRDDAPFTYVFTPEYEIPDFNLGNTFNYSDMAKLMTPRPFMVERGHDDGVSVDSWVAYEYAKVRKHYDELNLYHRTRIDYFNGPHTIHGAGTCEFLYHHLDWGEPFPW
jgi:dienelactone hydrolase